MSELWGFKNSTSKTVLDLLYYYYYYYYVRSKILRDVSCKKIKFEAVIQI